jgi:hypothetical protein
MTPPNAPLPTLTNSGKTYLQDFLDTLGKSHAAQCLTISNASGPIFDGRAGWFDPLDQNEGEGEGVTGRKAAFDDVLWFASTTKLITSVCELIVLLYFSLRFFSSIQLSSIPLSVSCTSITNTITTHHPPFLFIPLSTLNARQATCN